MVNVCTTTWPGCPNPTPELLADTRGAAPLSTKRWTLLSAPPELARVGGCL
ncbi:MAG TPA: hypothetical protein VMY40_00395 [Anaerolineae bacterium]|nr:hypothetical protein [Anaerolineae bacterium]